MEENRAALSLFLSKDEKEAHLFNQLMNAQEELACFGERERFMEGFCLGARLMLDTFISPGKSVIRDIT